MHREIPEGGRTEEVQHQGQEHDTLNLPHPAESYGGEGEGEGRGCRVWGRSVAGRDTGRRPGFINKLTACDCRPRSAAGVWKRFNEQQLVPGMRIKLQGIRRGTVECVKEYGDTCRTERVGVREHNCG